MVSQEERSTGLEEQPDLPSDERKKISYRFLKGKGIEIGALHAPLQVRYDVDVRYVDNFPVETLIQRYPELKESKFTPVDIIDDGEFLERISDNSLDFIIANHFLEHCENPLGTLRNHLKKIKPGGILYYSIPEKNLTFDKERPLTEFDHLIIDDIRGPSGSRGDHFFEWVQLVDGENDREMIVEKAKALMDKNYSIHFHVWDIETIFEFFFRANDYLNKQFQLLHFEHYGIEVITILQKK